MDEKNLRALNMLVSSYRSFQLGRRGAAWRFVAASGYSGYEEAYCDRLKCNVHNIDEVTIEDGHLRCYAEGGYVLILDIDLSDYTTVVEPIMRVSV